MKTNVFLINRPDRPIRLVNSLEQLKKVDLSSQVTRIEAETPETAQQVRYQYFSERAIRNIKEGGPDKAVIPTWGAAACALSHRKCWEQASYFTYDYSLILEDDIEITDHEKFRFSFQQALVNLDTISRLKHKPVIWLLGSKQNSAFSCDDPEIEKIYGTFMGLQSYLINRKAAKILFDTALIFNYQVDVQLGLMVRDFSYPQNVLGGLVIYNTKRAGVIQSKKFKSDIQPLRITVPIVIQLSHDKLNGILAQIVIDYLGQSDLGYYDGEIYYNPYCDYYLNNGEFLGFGDEIIRDQLS